MTGEELTYRRTYVWAWTTEFKARVKADLEDEAARYERMASDARIYARHFPEGGWLEKAADLEAKAADKRARAAEIKPLVTKNAPKKRVTA